jgi:hypothetical protein
MFIQVSEDEHIAIDTIASVYRYRDHRASLCFAVTTKRGTRYDVKEPLFVQGIKKLLNPEV